MLWVRRDLNQECFGLGGVSEREACSDPTAPGLVWGHVRILPENLSLPPFKAWVSGLGFLFHIHHPCDAQGALAAFSPQSLLPHRPGHLLHHQEEPAEREDPSVPPREGRGRALHQ